jgi:hypothetical protein
MNYCHSINVLCFSFWMTSMVPFEKEVMNAPALFGHGEEKVSVAFPTD